MLSNEQRATLRKTDAALALDKALDGLIADAEREDRSDAYDPTEYQHDGPSWGQPARGGWGDETKEPAHE